MPISESCEKWMELEFNQDYIQLRHRDEKILNLIKFYITSILTIGSACIAILKLGMANTDVFISIGLLIIITSLMGEIMFLIMLSFRRYFVTDARQLNAIRNLFFQQMTEEEQKYVIYPISISKPKMLNRKSSQYFIALLMTIINLLLFGLGSYMLGNNLLVSIILALLVLVLNLRLQQSYLKEKRV